MKRKYQDCTSHVSKHVITKLVIFSFLIIAMVACNKDDSSDEDLVGDWVKLSDYEGVQRYDAVSFIIDGKAYVGSGYNGDDRLNDFWQYDPVKNTWLRMDDLIKVVGEDTTELVRSAAVAFSIGSKGYFGTGYDGRNKLKDFYEFDPSQPAGSQWKQVDNFGGTARYGAIAFSIGNKGYVGTGYDGYYLKDFWEYDPSKPAGSQWTQKVSVGGSKRKDAVGFTINGKGYVCTGVSNGVYENDFWEYDPTNDTWTEKREISDVSDDSYDDEYTSIIGINKVAFTINGKGYVATGGQGTVGKIVWEYDPSTDLWLQKTSLEGSERVDAVAFGIGDIGYITTGRSSTYYFDDIWGFDPNAEYDDAD